ncbi:NAD-dependent epimerase/dehydratase family protein [Sediminibacterium roseum]|uniref:NAD-dependent epimerase/dehydratase family protein n=1 Tax=Sediminibacterium roseum TaxID=1978412 RepID=A0ABW9ZVZ4_9BACT|nr:NAD-dependent epimerase/dehydratase family protein [Sediminibacterium roseum]NCI51332.1 NAD-dependent epimerase/dehydratase family protein [Sediminibacterium roseum]
MNEQTKILVIGAAGQIGVELTLALRRKYGAENVFASDVVKEPKALKETGPWQNLDVLRADILHSRIIRLGITEIYMLAATLSATGEQDPRKAWKLNMDGLINVLDIAREEKIKLFWPSSIAVHAPTSTVYGISKAAGECWCQYYFDKYGVDVRSLRYPGLISYKTQPGGGTTDYAVDIFHSALEKKVYKCFLKEDTRLPMMYMPDAVRATIRLMEAAPERIENRMSYDVSAMSFTPAELYESIKGFCPEFQISYEPDHRQRIADTWPATVGDLEAREDWGWRPEYNLTMMVNDMLVKLEDIKMKQKIEDLESVGVL